MALTWNLPNRSVWVGIRIVSMLRAGMVSLVTGGAEKPIPESTGVTTTRTVTGLDNWLDTVTTIGELLEDRL